MANTRIKDLTTTAPDAANDDYLVLDGQTNGTRKILASNIGGSSITVDDTMSSSSENPVQNKVIYTALQAKADAGDIVTYAISISGNVITLTGSDSSTSTVTLPTYSGGVS